MASPGRTITRHRAGRGSRRTRRAGFRRTVTTASSLPRMEHTDTAPDAIADTVTDTAVDTVVEEELLVEEISIDGMCGVY
jgi:mycofactocin precursor